MYQHPLGRLLIYTDKETKEEFCLPEEIWNELFTLFVSTKYDVLDKTVSFIDFLNEVFFELTYTYANEDSGEQIDDYLTCYNPLCPPIPELEDPETPEELKEAKRYESIHHNINGYILYFVWYILERQSALPPHVKAFYTALDRLLLNKWSFDFDAAHIYDYADEQTDKFEIPFEIHPEVDINILVRSTEEWKEATDDFDRIVVGHIVSRFSKPEDKEVIVSEIRKHLEADNKGPRSNRMVSLVSHRKKANEKYLDSLLAEADESVTSAQASSPTGTIITGGFADYILKNRQRVIEVLSLISHLGNSQMPMLIKSVRALQQLGNMRTDCLEDPEDFVQRARVQFPDVNFDITNVKRQIKLNEQVSNTEYHNTIQKIAEYIGPVINV